MGLDGIGRAYLNKYRPNGPVRTYVYDRSFNFFNFGSRRSYDSNYLNQTIKYEAPKQSWLWDAADMIFSLVPIVGILGSFKTSKAQEQTVKPQGAKSATTAEAFNQLENTAKAMGFSVLKNEDGSYTAFNKNESLKGNYATVQKWLLNHGKNVGSSTSTGSTNS